MISKMVLVKVVPHLEIAFLAMLGVRNPSDRSNAQSAKPLRQGIHGKKRFNKSLVVGIV